MKVVVTKVGIEFEGKINLGDWNSLKLSQTRWADIILEEGEDLTPKMVNDVSRALFNDIRDQIRTWTKESKPKKDAPEMAMKVIREFAGKPIVDEIVPKHSPQYGENFHDESDDDSLIDPKLLSEK